MSDYHLIKPFYASFIYSLESVPPPFTPQGWYLASTAARYPHQLQTRDKPNAYLGATVAKETIRDGRQRRRRLAGCFLKVKFHFLSTYFPPFCDPPPPARLHPIIHRSTFNTPHPPPKYTFFIIIFSTLFIFFINTTNTDRWANSANLEILWNCYVMRLLCSRILILRRFIAVLPLNSTSLLSSSHSPMLDVEFCFNQADTRPKIEKKRQQRRFYGCMWRQTLCKLSSLTSCCPKKVQ